MSVPQMTFSTLIREMEGNNTTRDWDVLVSYDEEKINKVLEKMEQETSKDFVITKKDEDPNTGDLIDIEYRLKIANPTLQFTFTDSEAEVSYKLTGDYGKLPIKVPDNTTMKITAKIASLQGKVTTTSKSPSFVPYKEAIEAPENQWVKQGPNYVVRIADVGHAQGVCIIFRKCRVTLHNKSQDETVQRRVASIEAAVRQNISDEMAESGFHYVVSAVNAPVPLVRETTSVTLRPKSFCFSFYQRDEANKRPGALIMWIGVDGGYNNGDHEEGSTSLHFQPGDREVNPIPQKSSASIIIMHDLLARKFLMPALETKLDNVCLNSTKGTKGMELTGSLRNTEIRIGRYEKRYKCGLFNQYVCKEGFDGVKTNCDKPKTKIVISPRPVSNGDSVTLSYESDRLQSEWYSDTGTGGHIPYNDMYFNFEWAGTGKWEAAEGDKPNKIRLRFENTNEWIVKVSGSKPPWWIPDEPDRLPNVYEKLVMKVDIDIPIAELDYFLTTNLLFPGQHVFKAHAPYTKGDDHKGLAVPRDLILTGDVNDKLADSYSTAHSSRTSVL
ncbi:hypothetical protein BGW36DRAFT_432825 [Talaromyces proteolyticus]|uniref:Uncharacterized protein n=1 Tax=Talaromyces proteolyticus TaxID=1131652 RepID=A0AAD4PRU9_9EURO|nr:uncharacterized protein BGW36DRAFT_432825 [Talaromyces proteolyticus]KAH8689860.1 hypothetical protein BGW36DRAFT_432825 [Talaromyces proteolyticus]